MQLRHTFGLTLSGACAAILLATACRAPDRTPAGPNLTLSAGCDDQTALNYGSDQPCEYPTPCPAGSFTFNILPNGDLFIKYDQFPAPNDNSYGVNAVGWGDHGHKFNDLVGSDHAGVELIDPSGTVRLSFNVDYLTQDANAPSGYASLGVTGGDGKMLVGTADGITATTSLANNLNNINIPGLFNAAHVQQFGSVNVFMDSPPTDAAHTTYDISDPLLTGWDFHDTYFVTISAAKLASLGFDLATWQVVPNESQLHNSPAKSCPPVPGDVNLAVTKTEVKDKQVKLTITNSGTSDAFLSGLTLTWPTNPNGKLVQIKRDGDVIYDNPDLDGGSATLTSADLTSDQNHLKWEKGKSHQLILIFQSNADQDLTDYTGTASFGTVDLTILPQGSPLSPDLVVTTTEVKDKQVKLTITNSGTEDAFLSGLTLTWPSTPNGKLVQIKRDGDMIYDNPDLDGGSATLTSADLTSDPNHRKWEKGKSHQLILIFQSNADQNLADYTGTATFGDVDLTVLPQ